MAMSITKHIWSSLLRHERRSFSLVFVALILVSFALSPTGRAVDPPPDGGYPSENTAEGNNALFSLTSGANNTAIGAETLFGNTTGDANTAIGNRVLTSNTTGSANTAIGVVAL